jgi:hypothetical protein
LQIRAGGEIALFWHGQAQATFGKIEGHDHAQPLRGFLVWTKRFFQKIATENPEITDAILNQSGNIIIASVDEIDAKDFVLGEELLLVWLHLDATFLQQLPTAFGQSA